MLSPSEIAVKYGVTYVSDWYSRLRSRLYTQFRSSVTFDGFCVLLARQFQALEDSLLTLYTLPSIDDSEGVNLDVIGKRVGQPRTVADDATYRALLKARILANKSEGTAEQLYAMLRALLGAIGFLYIDGGAKQFVLKVIGQITSTQASIAVGMLGDAKESGARGILEWQESATANMLILNSTDPNQVLNAGALAGARQA